MNTNKRPTTMFIDLKSVAHNIKEVRRKISSETQVMAVIKASGYGSGAVNIARTLLDNGANRLGVAIAEEGIQLRQSGVEAPINVLTQPYYSELESFPEYDLVPAIADLDIAVRLDKLSREMNKVTKVHIEVDTGMGRIGVQPEEAVNFAAKLKKLKNIEVEGIFTHFASSDSNKSYTDRQISRFNNVLEKLNEKGIEIPLKHACNSAGIINYPEAHYNMVRAGLLLYGYYPEQSLKDKFDIKPSLSVKSKIIYLKEVPTGTYISYNNTHLTQRSSKIATIPMGYADGYRRELSNKGFVSIRGKIAPVVGLVCMDVFMVDVTGIDDAQTGDEVVIFDNCNITVEEIARMCGTINYEIITTIGDRVSRVYLK